MLQHSLHFEHFTTQPVQSLNIFSMDVYFVIMNNIIS
ncbi:hypothetical protein N483_23800 [Pseudoalteromonas luteoviolacea NCIMB 1944]|uniref:Uncharacterized protein n=1 Tax=Pseudoalteromonas luteoviolacea (strain 2ta16) TaxID=1353533 RepID=V4HWU1_PSEL2|nr:hypothetical protein PL2TA16_04217 [Pseudoalteromonas luteoviolacea 2ta16]KZN34969.1 hypothetical protein N483_23800 [Pseudoalteromonas luteoviolacea NCIMB 1944]